jgi:hypothetical protein
MRSIKNASQCFTWNLTQQAFIVDKTIAADFRGDTILIYSRFIKNMKTEGFQG